MKCAQTASDPSHEVASMPPVFDGWWSRAFDIGSVLFRGKLVSYLFLAVKYEGIVNTRKGIRCSVQWIIAMPESK